MYPTKNLQPGQSGPEVSQLQQFLLNAGYLSAQDIATGPGVYGPRTTAAVKKWQQANGVDNSSGPGYWGPKSIAAASGQPGSSSKPGGYTKEDYDNEIKNDKVLNQYLSQGNTVEDMEYASSTGDLSGMRNAYGQPFSIEEQKDALARAEKDNEAYYKALQEKETADTEASLAQKQADYQNYLLTSGQNFEADKVKADQNAANSGVLFSGGRIQKEKNLERAYAQEQAYKMATNSRDIANTARDFQYQYGEKAAKGLSDYYKLGGNTYNANVAQGGVGSTGLSSVYKPSQYDFKGTRIGERAADANKKATGYLWNKGNKLLASGYNNQY